MEQYARSDICRIRHDYLTLNANHLRSLNRIMQCVFCWYQNMENVQLYQIAYYPSSQW